MGYPDRQLYEDETVLWHRHPHWRLVAGPALTLPLLTLGAGVGIGVIERHGAPDLRVALYGLIGGAWALLAWWRCVLPWLRWRRTHFVVTDQRVLVREGRLRSRGIAIELTAVSDVLCRRSMGDRLVGAGTIVVRSATAPPLVCGSMAQPSQLRELIESEVDALYE